MPSVDAPPEEETIAAERAADGHDLAVRLTRPKLPNLIRAS